MRWTKGTATVGMVLCALIALLILFVSSQQIASVRVENEQLKRALAETATKAGEREASIQESAQELERLKRGAAETLKLRGEVASLRRDHSELTKLTEENGRLRERLLAAATNRVASVEPTNQ